MKVLKIAALVFAVAAAPMSLAIPCVAQVTTVDVQMAESAIVLAGSRAGRAGTDLWARCRRCVGGRSGS